MPPPSNAAPPPTTVPARDGSQEEGPRKTSAVPAAVFATPPPATKKRRHSSSADDTKAAHKQASKSNTTANTTTTTTDKKSTVTTVSAGAVTQMNVYDAVLAEASDLWQAASEAQQLGRLKMASSYLLLLHARLVGLGKRFDKAEDVLRQFADASNNNNNNNNNDDNDNKNTNKHGSDGGDYPATHTTAAAAAKTATTTTTTAVVTTPQKPKATTAGGKTKSKSTLNHASTDKLLTPNTAKVLSEMLPDDIELDQAMMEHLAKAAAELHAARSGRKRHGTEWQAGLTGYDYPTPLQRPKTTTEWELQQQRQHHVDTTAANTGIVWSLGEIRILQTALDKATQDDPPDAAALAKLLGRNPAQVRAFLRNQNTKSRIAADLALPTETSSGGTATATAHGNATAAAAAAGHHQNTDGDTPRRKGGRGPKPPTTAIHTVPNAECNASLLLLGGFLPPQEDPAQIGKLSDGGRAGKPKAGSSSSENTTKPIADVNKTAQPQPKK